MIFGLVDRPRKGGIPRGLSQTAPVLFSYGFRPFFLGAAIWALIAMILWIASLTGLVAIAEGYGATYWHGHEMLFGYSSAVLAGFLMTSVPNWTGKLPVSGWPLFFLFALWISGRIAFLLPDIADGAIAAVVDSLFLPILFLVCAREIVAGRKWKDIKVLSGLFVLSVGNILFHMEVIRGGHPEIATRLAVSAYVLLIMIVGGRIVPSFTRNWINKRGRADFPAPYDQFDNLSILAGIIALVSWVALSEGAWVASVSAIASVLQFFRLYRWRGWTTTSEHLVTVLHVAYFFVPLGFLGLALSAFGRVTPMVALHILTVGTVSTMMLAVMTRATRGHTGRVLSASRTTSTLYGMIVLTAILRPAADFLPGNSRMFYVASGITWVAAFGLFLLEYTPMLTRVRRKIS